MREAIELEQQEVQLLRDSLDSVSLHSAQSQGRLYETERRLRFTERYVKRLECHLVEIEQLAEQYGKQQRLREATERLAAAYSSSSGTQVSGGDIYTGQQQGRPPRGWRRLTAPAAGHRSVAGHVHRSAAEAEGGHRETGGRLQLQQRDTGQ